MPTASVGHGTRSQNRVFFNGLLAQAFRDSPVFLAMEAQ
jgi:hypothetical protein